MPLSGISSRQSGINVALSGNEAIARGALEAGVAYAASYPGSPTAEVLGVLATVADSFNIYVEWSINEIVAMEGAAAASFTGLRSLVVMKADGFNVAADFAGSLSISGCFGGMVIVIGDDPGAHSSIREEDTRNLCKALHLPMLEPTSVREAREMTKEAFNISEILKLPVVVRCVTRVCHASGDVELSEISNIHKEPAFSRENRVITFSIKLHALQEQKMSEAITIFNNYEFNSYNGPNDARRVIIASGPSFLYVIEALEILGLSDSIGVIKLGTTWPLPEYFLLKYLKSADEIIFAEEIEPFVEDNVMALAARYWSEVSNIEFYGKRSGHVAGPAGPGIGELDPDVIIEALTKICSLEYQRPLLNSGQEVTGPNIEDMLGEEMPGRDLALCAGCPHRASFWAIRTALELDNRDGVVIGDIGCYTLGIVETGYHLLQTLHCMGSGVGIATGMGNLSRFGFNKPVVCVLGDSTFYHAALPGLINARYHNSNFLCVLLDNETTAMTGHQPHPGRELTATGEYGYTVRMEDLIESIGIPYQVSDPYDIDNSVNVIFEMVQQKGPRVLILRRVCALASMKGKEKPRVFVNQEKCIGDTCGCSSFCSRVFACPANIWDEQTGKARIDEAVCNGCGVCANLCPRQAIIVETKMQEKQGDRVILPLSAENGEQRQDAVTSSSLSIIVAEEPGKVGDESSVSLTEGEKQSKGTGVLPSYTMEPINIIITGVGGQGNVLASKVIAAAAVEAGFCVSVGETFGVSQRGGSVTSHVRISRDKPCGPLIPRGNAHIVVGFEPLETIRVLGDYANSDTLVIMNNRPNYPLSCLSGRDKYPDLSCIKEMVKNSSRHAYFLPATELAKEAGSMLAANMVMTGALVGSDILPIGRDYFDRIIEMLFKDNIRTLNSAAFESGISFVGACEPE